MATSQKVKATGVQQGTTKEKKKELREGEKNRSSNPNKTISNNVVSFLLSLVIAFFPKCPICWASYMSIFGVTGIEYMPYSPWMMPVTAVLLLVNLFFLYRKLKNTNRIIPFIFSCTGSFLLILRILLGGSKIWLIPGLSLIFIGSLTNSLSNHYFNRLKQFFKL